MPLDARDAASLRDILDVAARVRQYVTGRNFDGYMSDPMVRDAIERCLEIIGEAARRLSPAFRDDVPDVPWRRIIGARNIVAHDYDEVNHETVWEIATVHVPRLVARVEHLLSPPPPDPDPEAA